MEGKGRGRGGLNREGGKLNRGFTVNVFVEVTFALD